MSLWNDEEPYPLNELIIAQLFFVDELKADAKNLKEPEYIQSLIRSEELTLQRLQALQSLGTLWQVMRKAKAERKM